MATRRPGQPRRAAARAPSSPQGYPIDAPVRRTAEVVLDVEVGRGLVHLVLANCGDQVASDVRVEFSRPLVGLGGTLEVSALPVFQHLGVLRPGRALRLFWDAAPTLLAHADRGASFVATVSWNERGRRRQRVQYQHDLAIYRVWPECVDSTTGQ